MRKLVLKIEYDGTNFAGWQFQPNVRSVQGEIEQAVLKLTGTNYRTKGSGRTDAGVHASGQVATITLDENFSIPDDKIITAFNTRLPKDIRINGAKITEQDFHPRFHAISREYSYNLVLKDSVFKHRFHAFYKYPINPDMLFELQDIFLGEKDFTPFSKYNPTKTQYICNVTKCQWHKISESEYRLDIAANRFVYSMVRLIVGASLVVARGKLTKKDLLNAFERSDRALQLTVAPPEGLVLTKVMFPEKYGLNNL